MSRPRLTLALAGAALTAAALAGCGSTSANGEGTQRAAATTTTAAAAAAPTKGPRVQVMKTDYGRILVNGRGRALYLFTADSGGSSNCSGDCATAWPPYVVKSTASAGPGAKPGKIGTIPRAGGGNQVTYAGQPLYFYEGDNEPGEVLCQAVNEFGGYWYVLRSNGRAVKSS